MSQRQQIASILRQVEHWPPEDRQALAIELMGSTLGGRPLSRPRDTLSLARAVAASIQQPAPDDQEVERYLHEHRVQKYGGLR